MKSTLILLLPAATSCVKRAFFLVWILSKPSKEKKISDGIFDDCFPHSLRDILEDVDENDVDKTFMAPGGGAPRAW